MSPLQKDIARLSRLVALFSVALGIIFFLIGRGIGLPFWQNFVFAIGIIVANVPEGLLPTVTLALEMGSQRMARRNALVRHLPSVETLGSATVVCTDKAVASNEPLYIRATAACLSAIVVMQIVNVFICRSRRQSVFSFGLLSNKLLLLGVTLEIAIILLIDYTPWGNAIFQTAAIPLAAWLFVVPFALAMLALEEFRKWFVRVRIRHGTYARDEIIV
jgi:magnesium-transporting ATPase (P-type)